MKVLIVEDENLAVKRLQKMLDGMEEPTEVVGVTRSIAETVSWLEANEPPEVMLLDIELADGQSFEIFNQTEVKSMVIFTTSYNEYALKAFQLNSIDYLLKPVEKQDLEKALRKYTDLKQLIREKDTQPIDIQSLVQDMFQRMNAKSYRKRFLVKSGSKFVSIDVEEIASFFVEGRLVFFYTVDHKKFIVDYTLDELETMLDPAAFYRINRSCFLGRKTIRQVEEHLGSRLFVHVHPRLDKETNVSREKVSAFKTWMGE